MAKPKAALADPTRLKPFDSADKQMLQVVIETPKGSRNKFAFNVDDHIFELKKVLPAGMAFPYDFGFVPSTEAEDGDPVDVLVLMDEPAFPGYVLKCRPIGVIQGEQGDKKKRVRNDRILAVEKDAHSWADITTIRDLGKQFVRELEEFFVDYHKLSGEQYRVLALKGRAQARKLVKSGMAYRRTAYSGCKCKTLKKYKPEFGDFLGSGSGLGSAPKKVPPPRIVSIATTRSRAACDFRTYP
jgi:inorganic pyrophosphatase